MFVQAYDTYLKVKVKLTDWNKRPPSERALLAREALKCYHDGPWMVMYFSRKIWWKIREFFPELKNRLKNTFNNL